MEDKELEKRKINPHCTYCSNCYYRFFKSHCKIKSSPIKTLGAAKTCDNYSPTLEPIEKRSLS